MKCLTIQIQPDRDGAFTPDDAISLSRNLGRYPEIDCGEDDGRFVNLNYFTEDLPRLWIDLRSGLIEDNTLGDWIKDVSIVVCEGEQGWDDYLLLWHWDSSEKTDVI